MGNTQTKDTEPVRERVRRVNKSYRALEVERMKNAELRKENNKPIKSEEQAKRSIGTQKGKFITNCIQAVLNNDEDLHLKYNTNTIQFVKKIIENAEKGNAGIITEILNRTEGKVKDQLEITPLMNLSPSQEEMRQLENQFTIKDKKKIAQEIAQNLTGQEDIESVRDIPSEEPESHTVKLVQAESK